MKLKSAVLALLLVMGALMAASYPSAHAISPVVQTTSQYCENFFSGPETELDCTAYFGDSISSADYVIAEWSLGNSTEASCLSDESCTMTVVPDPGAGYQDISTRQAEGNYLVSDMILYGPGTDPFGSVAFFFTLSNGGNITMAVTVYGIEVAGLDPDGFSCPGFSDCLATGSGNYTMSPTNPVADGSYLYVGFPSTLGPTTITPSGGYTTIATVSDDNYATAAQYKVSSSFSDAIDGTTSPSSSAWLMTGEIFGIGSAIATSTINVVHVVSCNFYELECWWEPLIFYGMYVGLWVGIGATMAIRARSMTYLFGAAVSYASMYLILLGELPYPFALMAFIGAFAYGLRLDGVF